VVGVARALVNSSKREESKSVRSFHDERVTLPGARLAAEARRVALHRR
jgi:hypothetical protein